MKVAIFEAESFKPYLKQFVIIIAAPRNSRLQEAIRLVDVERINEGKFSVLLLCWDDLTLEPAGNRTLFEKHFPQYIEDRLAFQNILEPGENTLVC